MKRIAILVIAASNRPLYVHYIKTYWTALIRHLGVTRPHIDVFLLFENSTDLTPFEDLRQHIIQLEVDPEQIAHGVLILGAVQAVRNRLEIFAYQRRQRGAVLAGILFGPFNDLGVEIQILGGLGHPVLIMRILD